MSFADATARNLDVQTINWTPVSKFQVQASTAVIVTMLDSQGATPISGAVTIYLFRNGNQVTLIIPSWTTTTNPTFSSVNSYVYINGATPFIPAGYLPNPSIGTGVSNGYVNAVGNVAGTLAHQNAIANIFNDGHGNITSLDNIQAGNFNDNASVFSFGSTSVTYETADPFP